MTYFIFFSCTYLQQKLKINSDWGRHKTFSEMMHVPKNSTLCKTKKNLTPCTIFVPIVISYLLLYSVKIVAFFVFNPPIYLGHKLHICLLFTRPLFQDDVIMLVNHFRGEVQNQFSFFEITYSISISFEIGFFLHSIHTKNITSSYNN